MESELYGVEVDRCDRCKLVDQVYRHPDVDGPSDAFYHVCANCRDVITKELGYDSDAGKT